MPKISFVHETKSDILDVLRNVLDALDKRDAKQLMEWSNHLIHSVALQNEQRTVYVSIIAYALGKIVEKSESLTEHKAEVEEFLEGIESNIRASIEFLEKENIDKFDIAIKQTMKLISEFDLSFSRYVQEVLQFSKVSKGAKVYEHGLSLASVAKILGINTWELMQKVGETKVHEHKGLTIKSTKERYDEMERIMNKKRGTRK